MPTSNGPSTAWEPSTGFHIVEAAAGDTVRLRPVGELDLLTADRLTERIRECLDEPAVRQVVVDLDGVSFLGSSGLHALVRGRLHADARAKACRVENPSRHVARVIEVCGLRRYLTDPTFVPEGGNASG